MISSVFKQKNLKKTGENSYNTKEVKYAHNAVKAGTPILDIKTLLSILDKDKSLRQFPDWSAKWFLENTQNLQGLLRSVEERAVLEQIVSETRPHLGLSDEEEQLMQSMADHYFEQGIEQGAHQMSIETTLNILTERFSNIDADALRTRLEAIRDLNRLKQLNLTAALAESFNAFQETLNAD